MWYFAWLLGLPLAGAFAVLNAMWYELMDDAKRQREAGLPAGGRRGVDAGIAARQ
jgi:cyd operon protein YbgT